MSRLMKELPSRTVKVAGNSKKIIICSFSLSKLSALHKIYNREKRNLL